MIVCKLVGYKCHIELAGVEEHVSLHVDASKLICTCWFDMLCASCIQNSFIREFRDGGGAWVFGTQVREAGKDMGGLGVHLVGKEKLESKSHFCKVALQFSHSGLGPRNDWRVCIHGL
jgi:hypothetical protein